MEKKSVSLTANWRSVLRNYLVEADIPTKNGELVNVYHEIICDK